MRQGSHVESELWQKLNPQRSLIPAIECSFQVQRTGCCKDRAVEEHFGDSDQQDQQKNTACSAGASRIIEWIRLWWLVEGQLIDAINPLPAAFQPFSVSLQLLRGLTDRAVT